MANVVTLTPDKLANLRAAYASAQQSHAKDFGFEGIIFCTEYAKYMLEFIEEVLSDSPTTEIELREDSAPFESQPVVMLDGDDPQDCNAE